MILTVEQISRWIADRQVGAYIVRLSEGDAMPGSDAATSSRTIEGPATVILAIYRDGGWYAYPQTAWTPEDIVR